LPITNPYGDGYVRIVESNSINTYAELNCGSSPCLSLPYPMKTIYQAIDGSFTDPNAREFLVLGRATESNNTVTYKIWLYRYDSANATYNFIASKKIPNALVLANHMGGLLAAGDMTGDGRAEASFLLSIVEPDPDPTYDHMPTYRLHPCFFEKVWDYHSCRGSQGVGPHTMFDLDGDGIAEIIQRRRPSNCGQNEIVILRRQAPSIESTTISNTCTVPPLPAPNSINLSTDIVYNTTVAGANLKLDIVWPLGSGLYPLVLVIHGGGWGGGDKYDMRDEILRLAGLGYAAAAPNYRLVTTTNPPTNTFPAAVEDVRCALRFLRANSQNFSIDPNRVAALGVSAGGHLASMLATANDASGLDGNCPWTGPISMDAAISHSAPHDLTSLSPYSLTTQSTIVNFLGFEPSTNLTISAFASPRFHVDPKNDPIFLLIHSDTDSVVPLQQSRLMKSVLNESGIAATLVPLTGVPHNHEPFGNAPPLLPSTCTSLQFLEEKLQP